MTTELDERTATTPALAGWSGFAHDALDFTSDSGRGCRPMGGDLADDAVLVEALRAGDETAFAWMLDRYDAPLRRMARNFVPTAAIADEVVQDTWLGVIKGIDRFRGLSSVKTWLYQIMLNTARTRGVRESRSLPFSSALDWADEHYDGAFEPERFRGRDDDWPGGFLEPPPRWEPAANAEGSEVLEHVRAAMATLPDAQRTVMTLRDVEGWGSDEVCDLLGITQTNQRVLLHRARARVRAALEVYFEGAHA